nr:hypothetical protein KPHV_81200 [Kitasatospora purpeofusca]
MAEQRPQALEGGAGEDPAEGTEQQPERFVEDLDHGGLRVRAHRVSAGAVRLSENGPVNRSGADRPRLRRPAAGRKVTRKP